MSIGYRFGNAELRPSQRTLLVGGEQSRIGARAFDLLLTLVEHRDRVVPKDELLGSVWRGLVVEENNLQVHISSLRKVLGPTAITTIPGRGYRFTAALDGAASNDERDVPGTTLTASAPPADASLTNLPAVLPPIYGREDDLRILRALVESNALVTVVGPGGIGKSTVAQALAHRLRPDFADGVWRVDLSSLVDGSVVATSVASVLRVLVRADAPVESLARSMGARRLLLVLDNCEHVAQDVAALADAIHRAAPDVKILATSQEPLKVPQEQVCRIGALALPVDASDAAAPQAGAIALFEARARAADPSFRLAADDVAAVADICRHLDGIPLAIEMAAARVPLLGLGGLRARLGERFRVLTGGSRLALPRHQTLRAALDWSHGLLSPQEQTVFRRLGVFAGSFGLDSAQRVAGDERIDGWAVLEHLAALVDKSMVAAEAGDEPRYRLLETTRAFALEKLAEAGETEVALRSHANAVLALLEQSQEDEFILPRQARVDRYLPELDEVRAALDWAAGPQGDAVLQVALAGAIGWIWVPAGLRGEGMHRSRQAMARIDAATPPAYEARLLAAWPVMCWPEVGPSQQQASARAIALYRSMGDRERLYCALCELGRRCGVQGDAQAAGDSILKATQLFDPTWPPGLQARLPGARGCVALEKGRFEETVAAYGEQLRLARAMGDRRLALSAMINQEQGIAGLERWDESAARGREMLELLEQDRDLRPGTESIVLGNLLLALTELGELDEALVIARRAFALREQEGNGLCMLDPLARLALRRGHLEDAARILGRADFRYRTSHFVRQTIEASAREKVARGLEEALPSAQLASLMKEGEALSDDEAGRLALR